MKKRFFPLWMPVIFWCGVIFYLSSLSVKPPTGTILDIILPYGIHLFEYGILFWLLWRIFKTPFWPFLLSIIYAFSDEFHQAFVPTRTPDIMDLLIDIVGMVIIYLIVWKFLPKAPEKLKNLAKAWQII